MSAASPVAESARSAPDGERRARAGWAAGLLLVAAFEFTASYDGLVTPLFLVLATFLPFAIVWGGVATRVGAPVAAFVSIVLIAVGAGLALRGSVADALPRLLTTPRPAPAGAALLAPSVVLVALVATVVAFGVLTPAVGGSIPALVTPVVGSAVVYAGALTLSGGAADPHGIVAAALVVAAVLGWSTPYLRGRSAEGWRPTAVVPLAASVIVALAAAALVPSGAFDPRQHVTPPTVSLTASSPLTQFASWTANPGVEIFRAHVTGTNRLQLAVLSTFSGASWQVEDHYRALGLDGRPDLPAGSRRSAVTATIRVSRLGSVWVPAAGTTTDSTLSGTLTDPDDGTLAHLGGLPPGQTYDLRGTVADPTDSQLEIAPVPVDPPARYLDLPHAPPGFAQYAREAIRGSSTPLEEAVALEHAVSTDRRVVRTAPSGSSYGRLQTFLFAPAGSTGAQAGTPEQFAAAFAVLAREVGLPTRLVVGFDIPNANAGGTSVVHGSDATVWPEVYFSGAGWVQFAPTPGTSDGSDEAGLRNSVLQRISDRAASAPPIRQPIAPGKSVRPPDVSPTAAPAATSRGNAAKGLPGWLVGLLVGLALIALLVALLLVLRARRVARHRRAGAAGVWAEFLDLLVLLGRSPTASAAAPEVAADFDADYPHPGARAARLAVAADRAAFSPANSPSEVDPDLWRDLRVLRRRARASVPPHRRALWPVDPRPVLRRH